MKYAERLEEAGWTEGLSAFEDLLADLCSNLCPAWSVDMILINPRRPGGALSLIREVLARAPLAGSRNDLDNLILGILLTSRKNHKRREARESVWPPERA